MHLCIHCGNRLKSNYSISCFCLFVQGFFCTVQCVCAELHNMSVQPLKLISSLAAFCASNSKPLLHPHIDVIFLKRVGKMIIPMVRLLYLVEGNRGCEVQNGDGVVKATDLPSKKNSLFSTSRLIDIARQRDEAVY